MDAGVITLSCADIAILAQSSVVAEYRAARHGSRAVGNGEADQFEHGIGRSAWVGSLGAEQAVLDPKVYDAIHAPLYSTTVPARITLHHLPTRLTSSDIYWCGCCLGTPLRPATPLKSEQTHHDTAQQCRYRDQIIR